MRNLAVLFVCLFTGCSSFNKEWKAAGKSATPPRGIEGRWAGEWRSEKNSHHGALKAVITQTSPTTYRAHYRATYKKILHFSYVATLNGSRSNNVVTLEGQSDLGKLAGGIYTYKATATPTEFRSTYKSKYDHGHYELRRPAE
jgi:hypothetical protein